MTTTWPATEWAELEVAAVLYEAFVRGRTSAAAELRRRTAALGATATDRARLRIFAADADAKESKASPRTAAPRRYPALQAVDPVLAFAPRPQDTTTEARDEGHDHREDNPA
ncbi:hypothetical protein [Kineococcus aurantiacus]|uniref:Uncharacterized protein n=1 Tax=Kineococcus aurantiacus TaxID=37633 RepID=A0A7Y9DJM9_9ACTN|nr:hypothetical protein [Kineococcus aurantiacus]NYD21372.1 hypothetical protein [Kineococcus aurantiacus]